MEPYELICIIFIALLTIQLSKADLLLEPTLGYRSMKVQETAGALHGPTLGLQLGIVNDKEYFLTARSSFSFLKHTQSQSSETTDLFGLGINGGKTLQRLPLRVSFGIDFKNDLKLKSQNDDITLKGINLGGGLGYYISNQILLNMDYRYQMFKEASLSGGDSSQKLDSDLNAHSVLFSISIPIEIESSGRLCQVVENELKISPMEPPPLSTGARHLLPCIKRTRTKHAMVVCFQQVAANVKQIMNLAVDSKKSLGLSA